MRLLIILFFNIFFSNIIFAEEIKIIELHNKDVDKGLINAIETEPEELSEEQIQINDVNDEIIENNNEDIILSNEESIEVDNNEITTLPDFWERSKKEDLIFLFENIKHIESSVLREVLTQSLIQSSLPPENFNEEDFNHLKIMNLIKLGQRKKAFEMLNLIDITGNKKDFYNSFELNYYFSTYDLNQACDYRNNIDQKTTKINKNFLLKVDIFCSFIENKVAEADFLNSLLIDSNDSDIYFQKIYSNLKNSNNSLVEINNLSYDENSIPLYSAMIRVGDMPINKKFLEYDPINLAEPIILSSSSDISLRLKAANHSYKEKNFNAESMSALYQTVDFSYEELNNNELILKKFSNDPEILMTYFFQRANIQILPITRIETLIDFWKFAEENDLSLLAYDISRKLIDTIEPSAELADYSIEIAKAHIYNDNLILADKWILFSESYTSDKENFDQEIQSIKLLYNLKNSEDDNEFKNILLANLYQLDSTLYNEMNKNTTKQEILLTILSVISDNSIISFDKNKNLVDQRSMPSMYLLNKIRDSYRLKNYGELILCINLSMINKNWNDTHPEHLRIVLLSLQDNFTEGLFRKIILEILEDTKII